MKKNGTHNERNMLSRLFQLRTYFVLLALAVFVGVYSFHVSADPTGVSILGNVTDTAPEYFPDNRSDQGGTITTLELSVTQQNSKWKAYVGNITGVLTLDDALGNSIFQWNLGAVDITGEVYVSRSSGVAWGDLNCSNVSLIEDEETFLGFTAGTVDSINYTFNETTHTAINVAGMTISADTCRSTSTFINDTRQDISDAIFQEVLLASGTDIVYTTKITQNVHSYNNDSFVDFQLIVPDDVTTAITTYFFYAEIGS